MTIAVLALATVVVAFACWFASELLKQNGRILDRLESLEGAFERLALTVGAAGRTREDGLQEGGNSLARSRLKRDGLAPGTAAPDFRLPRLGGGELSLAEFRGQRVLLVFSDPQCGPCDVLAPRLERRSRAEEAQVVMVSRGDPEVNRAKVAQLGLSFPVGLQSHWEISQAYGMFATPIAFLIDEDGIVSAPVAKGPDAILALLSRAESILSDVSARRVSTASVGAEA